MFDLKKLQDRRYFDEKDIPSDVWSVLRAASLLNIGEFQVFEMAYQEWYGEKGDESTIERHFIPYMFNEIVPPWVRHFCARIRSLDDDGDLDLERLGIVRPSKASADQKWRGIEAFVWIFGTLLVLIILGDMASRIAELRCQFPPCG